MKGKALELLAAQGSSLTTLEAAGFNPPRLDREIQPEPAQDPTDVK